ncbi:MAG: hypothetical protein DMD92_00065 [Candidatus Rokuibacteriota bacterium]|nr:MAG: hypothetical protein DMD92_00065 [Candidatus Rokubacteria bacterium]
MWLRGRDPLPSLAPQGLSARLSRVARASALVLYLAGLARPEAQEALGAVRALARRGPVTLLCGCADETRCHRSLLRDYLLD